MRVTCLLIPLLLFTATFTACDLLEEGLEIDGLRIGGDYSFPEEHVLENSLSTYITAEGLQWMEENGLELVALLLESDPGHIDVSDFINDYLTENPISLFGISLRDVEASATFPDGSDTFTFTVLASPTRLRVEISEVWVAISATVYDDQGSVTSACRIAPAAEIEETYQSIVIEDMVLDIILGTTFSGELDISTDIINLGLSETDLRIITSPGEPGYYCELVECQDGCLECQLFCEAADLIFDVGELLTSLFESFIGDFAEIVVNMVLGFVRTIEGQMHPALLLGDLLPLVHDSEWFGFLFAPSSRGFEAVPRSDDAYDLQVNLSGGVEAETHPCVLKSNEDPFWSSPSGYGLSSGDTSVHIAMAVSDTYVDQFVWTAYQSGALCLFVDTEMISALTDEIELNAGLVSLMLPGLDQVADADAPLLLSVLPHFTPDDFPLVRFGTGVEDSLINLVIDDATLGLYAWEQGRYLRLFEIRAEVLVGLTVNVLPDNSIEIAIDEVGATLTEESYNELFVGVELTELVNFVIDLAVSVMASIDTNIELSLTGLVEELLGIPYDLYLKRLTTAGEDNRWIEVAINLVETTGETLALRGIDTEVEVLDLSRGRIELLVDVPGYRPEQFEYQVRFGGFGAWSGYYPGAHTELEHSFLTLAGHRTMEVRARVIGDYRSLDMSPALIELDVPDWSSFEMDPLSGSVPTDASPLPVSEGDELTCTSTRKSAQPWVGFLVFLGLCFRRRQP